MNARIPYDPWPSTPCYVRGCRERPSQCAIHRHRGRVQTCQTHDPNRHGYGLPLPATQAPGLAALLDRPDVGPQPPVRPVDEAPDPRPSAPPARALSFTF